MPATRPAAPWIISRWPDLAWIVATPLLVYLGITAAQQVWSGEQITVFALIFAIGHHLPGMMRAYGDRALFARFRWRFLLAPLFFGAVCIAAAVNHLTAVAMATGIWGWWHYLMQTYGFARIYDGKAGSLSPATQRLDHAMCVAWFAAPLALTSNGLMTYLNQFYKSGGPVISSEWIGGLRTAAVAGTAVVTALFLANLVREWRRGRPPSPMKLALMGTTFTYYWYALATVENILVSYALFELFHDTQYLAIVWVYNRKRVEKDPCVGSFTRFLFRERGWLIGLYVLCVAGYGLLNYFAKRVSRDEAREVLLGFFAASTLLHYYYDGFIWKLREPATRQPLGIGDGAARALRPALPRWAWHAALWVVFATPVLGLVILEFNSPPGGLEKQAALAAALPESAFAHRNLGVVLAEEKRFDEAIEEYRRAVALNPYLGEAHYNLGAALIAVGQEDEAVDELRRALRLIPGHPPSHYNLAVALQKQSRLEEAERHYRAAAARSSKIEADAHHALAALLEQFGRLDAAAEEERASLRVRPGFTAARFGLAEILARRGSVEEARREFAAAVAADRDSFEARTRMATAFEAAEMLAEAEADLRKALAMRPDSANATNALGVSLARQNRLAEAADAFRRAVELDPDHAQARQNLTRARELLAAGRSGR